MRCIWMLAAAHLKKRSFQSVLARIATIYGIWKQWNQRVHGSNTFISWKFDQRLSVKWYHTECTKLRLFELSLLYWPFKNDCFNLKDFMVYFQIQTPHFLSFSSPCRTCAASQRSSSLRYRCLSGKYEETRNSCLLSGKNKMGVAT